MIEPLWVTTPKRSPSPSKASPQSASVARTPFDEVDEVARLHRVGMMVGEVAIDSAVEFIHQAAEATQQSWRCHARHAIAAIDHDLGAVLHLDIGENRLLVGFNEALRFDAACTLAQIIRLDARAQALDGVLGQWLAAQHHLQAVVVGRIVAAGDHDAGAGFSRLGRKVQHRRWHHADVDDFHAALGQALVQRLMQGRPRMTSIPARHRPIVACGQCFGAERASNLAHHRGIEVFIDDAANVVGGGKCRDQAIWLFLVFLIGGVRLCHESTVAPGDRPTVGLRPSLVCVLAASA